MKPYRPVGGAAAAVALGLVACQVTPTQLVVAVRTDLPATELDEFRIRVLDPSGALAEPERRHPFAELPASFGVAPKGGDPSRHVEVQVDAALRGRTLFTTRAATSFVEDRASRLDLFLARRCVHDAPTCPEGETCGPSGCEPVERPSGSLERFDGIEPALDGGVPPPDGEWTIALPLADAEVEHLGAASDSAGSVWVAGTLVATGASPSIERDGARTDLDGARVGLVVRVTSAGVLDFFDVLSAPQADEALELVDLAADGDDAIVSITAPRSGFAWFGGQVADRGGIGTMACVGRYRANAPRLAPACYESDASPGSVRAGPVAVTPDGLVGLSATWDTGAIPTLGLDDCAADCTLYVELASTLDGVAGLRCVDSGAFEVSDLSLAVPGRRVVSVRTATAWGTSTVAPRGRLDAVILAPQACGGAAFAALLGGAGDDEIPSLAVTDDMVRIGVNVSGAPVRDRLRYAVERGDEAELPDPPGGSSDGLAAALGHDGELLWARWLGWPGEDAVTAVAAGAQGDLWVAGWQAEADTASDATLEAVDAQGVPRRIEVLGAQGVDRYLAVATSGAFVVVAGTMTGPVPGAAVDEGTRAVVVRRLAADL